MQARMSPTREQIAAARAGFPARAGSKKLIAARSALARELWDAKGARRIPAPKALDRALSALPPAELAWLTEMSPMGPLYLFPTRPFLRALARQIRALGVTRVLEVAAGDGHLARALASVAPDLKITASDSGSWARPSGRMSAKEKRAMGRARAAELGGIVLGEDVLPLDALRAIAKVRPQLVLASWLPPGPLLSKLIRAPVKFVLEIGAGSGITGDAACWRFAHDFCDGPLETLARCRLDDRPARALHSRVTLYFGRKHAEFLEEKLGADHWLRSLR